MAKTVEAGSLVTIFVTVWDLRGNIVDQTGEEGVSLRCGSEDVFPRMDQALVGKKEGESFDVILEPEESFGDFDENLVHLVPVASLGVKNLKKGMRFSHIPGVPVDEGRAYIVTDIADGQAVLDGNHPYAGWTLRFSVKVLRVESLEEGDVDDSDIFIPDFLKPASASVKREAEEMLDVERARKRISEALDRREQSEPAHPMGSGLFTSFVPKKDE
ncbi:FKBP-type peptidyl-prolyl cis-trans isomerase [Mesosutterella sp. AGMB02718]|uniref:Peptidyl-prolyl cis-trans isomerase n=1 Tax=Mesosutterella faecium TaxID=2925194 RepID=A0ABT7IN81_9BURK|nr:FKBP-type peptidyl-prolyl cis-trans isomerase [Mesosutterella sp. AGMB02718]MDL2059341.1 FKBP-type peptidyl-prolyl cis-trans isomerase [Mesosutterella sp. AGMB02718]